MNDDDDIENYAIPLTTNNATFFGNIGILTVATVAWIFSAYYFGYISASWPNINYPLEPFPRAMFFFGVSLGVAVSTLAFYIVRNGRDE